MAAICPDFKWLNIQIKNWNNNIWIMNFFHIWIVDKMSAIQVVPIIWIADTKIFYIQMVPLFKCPIFRSWMSTERWTHKNCKSSHLFSLATLLMEVPRDGASEGAKLSPDIPVSGRSSWISSRSGYSWPGLGGETRIFFNELTPKNRFNELVLSL